MACQKELMETGQPYPKTCEECGLFGPCRRKLDGTMVPTPTGRTVPGTSFYVFREVDPELVGVICGQIPCLFNGEDLVVCVQDLNDLLDTTRRTLENNHEREAI